MYLQITLNPGTASAVLITKIIDCIRAGKDDDNNEIKIWSIEDFHVECFSGHKPTIKTGIKHKSDQYEDLGWLELISGEELIAVDFYLNSSKRKDGSIPNEQITVLMCKFASALRNHFGDHIEKIGLYGL